MRINCVLPQQHFVILILVGITLTVFAAFSEAAPSFSGIGDITLVPVDPNDPFASQAHAVSPDGTKVTGFGTIGSTNDGISNTQAFIWTASTGITALQLLPDSIYFNQGQGITNTGIVGGHGDAPDPLYGFAVGNPIRWDPNPTKLAFPAVWDNGAYTAGSNAVDGSGNVIVGYASDFDELPGDHATAWVGGAPQLLDYFSVPPGGQVAYSNYSYASGVNTPGNRITGVSYNFTAGDGQADGQAVLWSDATAQWSSAAAKTPIKLGFVPGANPATDSVGAEGHDVSNDGQIVVGNSENGSTNSAIAAGKPGREAQVGFVVLGIPGGVPNAMAALPDLGSNDGTTDIQSAAAMAVNGSATTGSYTAVGWGYNGLPASVANGVNSNDPNREALIWINGAVQNIETFATGLGLSLTGWDLQEALGISDDGKVIVGWGFNPQGNNEGWVLTLPATTGVPGDYNGNGIVDAGDYVLWRKGGPLQNDPTVGVSAGDYTFWRSRFGANSGSGSGLGGTTAVPEPSSFVISILCLSAAACRRRRVR